MMLGLALNGLGSAYSLFDSIIRISLTTPISYVPENLIKFLPLWHLHQTFFSTPLERTIYNMHAIFAEPYGINDRINQ